jgi:histone-lysine N-methyltransferase SETD3
MTTHLSELQKLLSTKQYSTAIELLEQNPEVNALEAEKQACNLSYIYYLMGKYETAKEVIDSALTRAEADGRAEVWPRLYYRLAKAHEGLQDYDAMCSAYDQMYERLPEDDRDKKLKHMQDYYNKNVNYMIGWVVHCGGYAEHLQVEYYDVDYRGLTLSSNIKKKENVIRVPYKCVFGLRDSKINNPYVRQITKAGLQITAEHTFVAFDLIHEKHTNGARMPYIRCLPKEYSNIPFNFTLSELTMLAGSYSLIKILQKLLSYKIEYTKYQDVYLQTYKEMPPFTFAEFVWGRTAVITRIYKVNRGGNVDNVMVPVADMANHAIPPNTGWKFDDSADSFVVDAETNLSKGAVIYETYGEKCNYRYFVNYGFTVDNNPYEEATIQTNAVYRHMLNAYAKEVISSYDQRVVIRELFDLHLFSSLDSRFVGFVMEDKSAYQIGYTYNDVAKKLFAELRGSAPAPISREDETKVHEQIVSIVDGTLSGFLTSIEEDETLLANNEYTFNLRNTIVQRKEEKKVLEYWKTLSKNFISALTDGSKRSFKKLNKKMNKWAGFASFAPYIAELEKLK